MSKSSYNPETYWSEVAEEVASRQGANVIAGDDEPYYIYKRKKFLKMLHELPLEGKHILEIGPGPGGNLLELAGRSPGRLAGVDISNNMLRIAKQNLGDRAELFKTDGSSLPFEDQTFDMVFSATVLQHNSDDQMMRTMAKEMARVSRHEVFLFEQVDRQISGDDLMRARPVSYYAEIMNGYGFELADYKMIDIIASYFVSGAIRKGLNPSTRKEGEPLTGFSIAMQKLTLPITKMLDKVIKMDRDLARMRFVRKQTA